LTLNSLCLSDASNRRPLLAAECESLPDAEKWRRDIIRDITKKIAATQNGKAGFSVMVYFFSHKACGAQRVEGNIESVR